MRDNFKTRSVTKYHNLPFLPFIWLLIYINIILMYKYDYVKLKLCFDGSEL